MKKLRNVSLRQQDLILKDSQEMIEEMETSIEKLRDGFRSMQERLEKLSESLSPIESPPAIDDVDSLAGRSVVGPVSGEGDHL
jgi:uncharacterized coiled-coil protein SlyX